MNCGERRAAEFPLHQLEKRVTDIAKVKFLYETIINDDGILFAFGSSDLSEENKTNSTN